MLVIHEAPTSPQVHQQAPSAIISLSWALLVIPCILLVAAFAWIIYNFGNPSDSPQANRFGHVHYDAHQHEQDHDEKEQLLDAFHQFQSHSATPSTSHLPSASTHPTSASSWKISSKFSTTSRGGSIYTTYPDPNHASSSSSPNSNRTTLTIQPNPSRAVGSKAAKVLALNRDRMMHHLEDLDPIDRQQLQRSSSRASDTRKSD